MRAFALNEINALRCPRGAKHGETHGARHLYSRAADSTACAVHEDRFRSMCLRGMMQSMVGGSIRHPDGRALGIADFFRQAMHLTFKSKSVVGIGARDSSCCIDAVTRLYFLDAIANRLDYSCGVGPRRVGKRWFYCIGARAHVGVVGIHARGMDAHENLPGGRLRRWGLF